MTKATFYFDGNVPYGFLISGHSGFASEGEDIVCAAISILTIKTMNAIGTFTDADASLESDEEIGFIEFKVKEPTKETSLLLDTMVLGLQTMADDENYAEYIDLLFEEV